MQKAEIRVILSDYRLKYTGGAQRTMAHVRQILVEQQRNLTRNLTIHSLEE